MLTDDCEHFARRLAGIEHRLDEVAEQAEQLAAIVSALVAAHSTGLGDTGSGPPTPG